MTRTARQAAACIATLAALATATLPLGCATSPRQRAYDERERALKLIDQGKQFELDEAPLLALERYNRAALVHPSPAAYFEMGRIFEGQAKPQEAATAYQEALRLAPDFQEARFAMLALGFTPEGYAPTEADLQLARRWAEENRVEVAMTRADGQTTGTASEAELAARREQLLAEAAARRQPTQAEVRTVLFSAVPGNRLPSATDPIYAAGDDVILGTYAYHFRKAQQFNRRGQYEKAAEEYDRAITADPKEIDARLELGDMMLKLERYPRAQFHYQKALDDFPASPRPSLKMGNYLLALKRPEEARGMFRQALDKDPNYAEAWNNLSVLAMQEKNWDEARKMLDELIQLDPEYANAYLNRGIIADDIDKNREAALKNYRRYVELQGPRAAQVQRWIRDMEAEPARP